MTLHRIYLFISVFFLFVFLSSCQAKESYFYLDYGLGMKDISFIFPKDQSGVISFNQITLDQNFLFISDKLNQKILYFNMSGDLLKIFHHPSQKSYFSQAENPLINLETISTQYDGFNMISNIAIKVSEYFFVQNTLDKDKWIYNKDTQQYHSQEILVFDYQGKFTFFLGEEGIHSTPFAYIQDIYTYSTNLYITTQGIGNQWFVFEYDPEFRLIQKLKINQEIFKKQFPQYINNLEKIYPSGNQRILYFIINLYNKELVPSFDTISSIQLNAKALVSYDLETKKWNSLIFKSHKIQEMSVESSLGLIKEDKFVLLEKNSHFLTKNSIEFYILIYDKEGNALKRKKIYLPQGGIYAQFALSYDGILLLTLYQEKGALFYFIPLPQ